jgi:hypothetical protein
MNQATHCAFSRTFAIFYCSNDCLANFVRSAATCQKHFFFSYCILCLKDCWCNLYTCFIACLSFNIPFGTLCILLLAPAKERGTYAAMYKYYHNNFFANKQKRERGGSALLYQYVAECDVMQATD